MTNRTRKKNENLFFTCFSSYWNTNFLPLVTAAWFVGEVVFELNNVSTLEFELKSGLGAAGICCLGSSHWVVRLL